MAKRKKLSKKQLAVIEDLFSGELDEQTVLDKHQISRYLYNKWLADERFTEQFDERIARSYRQSRLIIARYAPLAAAKLVQLTECDKEETVRKACLDIISLPALSEKRSAASAGSPDAADAQQPLQLSPETAGRLLAALADENANHKA